MRFNVVRLCISTMKKTIRLQLRLQGAVQMTALKDKQVPELMFAEGVLFIRMMKKVGRQALLRRVDYIYPAP